MEQAKKIRVFVVDDSLVFRSFLIQGINKDPRFEVIGSAVDAYDAAKQIPELKPDVVTLDIEMPGMSGLEFLTKLLPIYPVPVILVTTLNLRVFEALAAGAVDYVRKPAYYDGDSVDAFSFQLKPKLVIASRAKVHLPTISSDAAKSTVSQAVDTQEHSGSPKGAVAHQANVPKNIIAIGASTGGTEAILSVIKDLPENTPGVIIAQHMPSGFTSLFAERLNKICKMEVREAKNGDRLRQGLILIAPGGYQTRVVRRGIDYWVTCNKEDKVNGVAPSVDVLFNSVAQQARDQAIGVILTGMGHDGAMGLLKMSKNGAYTIGQDEESSVVYGMPMEAHKIGAVQVQANINNIAGLITKELKK